MAHQPSMDCSQTVRAIIAQAPATESVFLHHGIDVAACAAQTVEDAALQSGADPDVLCAVLRAATRTQPKQRLQRQPAS